MSDRGRYLNTDTTAFLQLVQGNLFTDFPDLKLIIPHSGGVGRAGAGGTRDAQRLLRHLRVPPDVVPNENILFDSEMIGASPPG
ncbi:hypothetical protein ACWGSK_08975 [Nocardiopsis sp. NPDC055551]